MKFFTFYQENDVQFVSYTAKTITFCKERTKSFLKEIFTLNNTYFYRKDKLSLSYIKNKWKSISEHFNYKYVVSAFENMFPSDQRIKFWQNV